MDLTQTAAARSDVFALCTSFLPTERVDLDGLPGPMYFRSMRGSDALKFSEASKDAADARPLLVALSACNELGLLTFGAHDLEALAQLPHTVLDAFTQAALRANKMTAEDGEGVRKN